LPDFQLLDSASRGTVNNDTATMTRFDTATTRSHNNLLANECELPLQNRHGVM